jgi:4-amino-4-deoxy-L-arabinose transferase-like glycosyltransferase
MRKSHLILFSICLIGISFSLFAIWFYGIANIDFGDTDDYINAARAFLNGTPYPRRSIFHPMFRPPLFPLLVAAIWSIFPDSIIAVKIFQALLHGGTVFLAYKIVYEIVRKEMPALLGAFICAINPLLVAHTVDFYTEPLHTFLCALGMYLLLKLLNDERFLALRALGAGMIFGLATLCRPAILGVAVCIAAAIVLMFIRDIKRAKYIAATSILLAGIALTIMPWTIQNYRDTGEFILVNDGFGYNLWLGNLPETVKLYEGGFSSKEENQEFANYIWGGRVAEKLAELEITDNFSALTINEKEKVWQREALKEMSDNPGITVRLMFGKLWSFWTPLLNTYTYGFKTVALVALFVTGIFLMGAYGAFYIERIPIGRKFVILLLVTFVVTTLIHVLIFGFVRYRVPNVDPYLSMLTGITLWKIIVKVVPKTGILLDEAV